MTLQRLHGVYVPVYPTAVTGAPTFGSLLIDAAGEKVAYIVQIPKTGTLGKAMVRFGAVTTAQDIKVSFQDVDLTTGDPDGTVDQFRVIPSASVIANTAVTTGLVTSDGTDGGTKRAVTNGDLLAVVVEFNATVGNLNLSTFTDDNNHDFPYSDLFTTVWTKNVGAPVIALEYDDGTYDAIEGTTPYETLSTITYNSGSATDERALRAVLPFPSRIVGAWLWADLDNAADLVLYDGDGSTVLRTLTLDPELRVGTVANLFIVRFAPVTLSRNVAYRLSLKPTTVGNVGLVQGVLDAGGVTAQDALPGGSAFQLSLRVDGGAWSQDTLTRPFMGLILDQFDDGTGALIQHGMTGGLRGHRRRAV